MDTGRKTKWMYQLLHPGNQRWQRQRRSCCRRPACARCGTKFPFLLLHVYCCRVESCRISHAGSKPPDSHTRVTPGVYATGAALLSCCLLQSHLAVRTGDTGLSSKHCSSHLFLLGNSGEVTSSTAVTVGAMALYTQSRHSGERREKRGDDLWNMNSSSLSSSQGLSISPLGFSPKSTVRQFLPNHCVS